MLIIASKRAPVEFEISPDGMPLPNVSPGGTATVVADQAALLGVKWLAVALTAGDKAVAHQHPDGLDVAVGSGQRAVHLKLLNLPPEVFDPVQYYFANEILWLVQHGIIDRWRRPTFTEKTRSAWRAYEEFSSMLAAELLSMTTSDATFILQDFQLMNVAPYLRAARPDARILWMSHSAWPQPETWSVMPTYAREAMILGALSADVAAFLCTQWAENFVMCASGVSGVTATGGLTMRSGGRATRVVANPLGYSEVALERRLPRLPRDLEAWAEDVPLVVHSGRTDPIKNAPRAIEAFGAAVDRLSRPAGSQPRLVVKMNPNRTYVPENEEYAREVAIRALDVNMRLGREAVRVIVSNDVDLTLGLLSRADVLFLNSVVDGMNLTAFEGAMVGQREPGLVLSERCGAAEYLGSAADLVNPFDVAQQADALVTALSRGESERRLRYASWRKLAEPMTLQAWVGRQLESLGMSAGPLPEPEAQADRSGRP
jgi:trehalose-6-phosphate synthase